MNSLNLDLSEVSTNTLGSLSDMSSLSSPVSAQAGGGLVGDFFDAIFGSSVSKCDRAVLEATRLKNYSVVEFMIAQGAVDLSARDKDGNTVLHYLVSDPNPNQALIRKILSVPNAKSFVNKQNKDGDTPLILAVKNQHHDLCSELIVAGSDKRIRNKEGLRVDTETPDANLMLSSPAPIDQQRVSALPLRDSWENNFSLPPTPVFTETRETEKVSKQFNPFMRPTQQNMLNTSEPLSFNLSDTQGYKFNETEPKLISNEDTERFLETLKRRIREPSPSAQMTGGGCGCSGNADNINTEVLVEDLQKYFSLGGSNGNNQDGGAKKKMIKKKNRAMDLSRIVNEQTDEIINKVIKKIQTLIGEDTKTFKGLNADEETARAAKAILWAMVREQHPDLRGLDVAVEMEKLATDEMIKSLKPAKIKKMMKDIQEHRKQREKEKAQQKSMSPTSSEEVPSVNMSETSY